MYQRVFIFHMSGRRLGARSPEGCVGGDGLESQTADLVVHDLHEATGALAI